MKKQYIGILFSVSLIAQPAMAAHLSVISWRGAELQNAVWNSKVLLPSDKGRPNIPEISKLVINGKLGEIKSLIAKRPNATEKKKLVNDFGKDPYKVTPLHYAAAKGNVQIIQALLGAGADPNAQDTAGRTPLMWAIAKAGVKSFDALVDKTNLMQPDHSGRIPLHWAVSKARFTMAQKLIQKSGLDAIRAKDGGGNTPLHYAMSIHYSFSPDKQTDPGAAMSGKFAKAAAIATAGIDLNTHASRIMKKAVKLGIAAPVADAVSFGGGGSGILLAKSNVTGTGVEVLDVSGESDSTQVSQQYGAWQNVKDVKPTDVLADAIVSSAKTTSTTATEVDVFDTIVFNKQMNPILLAEVGPGGVSRSVYNGPSMESRIPTINYSSQEISAMQDVRHLLPQLEGGSPATIDDLGLMVIKAEELLPSRSGGILGDALRSIVSMRERIPEVANKVRDLRVTAEEARIAAQKAAEESRIAAQKAAEEAQIAARLAAQKAEAAAKQAARIAADKTATSELFTPELAQEQALVAQRLAQAEAQVAKLVSPGEEAALKVAQQELDEAQLALKAVMDKIAVKTGLITEQQLAEGAAQVAARGTGGATGGATLTLTQEVTTVSDAVASRLAQEQAVAIQRLMQAQDLVAKSVGNEIALQAAQQEAHNAEVAVQMIADKIAQREIAYGAGQIVEQGGGFTGEMTEEMLALLFEANPELEAEYLAWFAGKTVPQVLESSATTFSSLAGDAYLAVTGAIAAVTTPFTINITAGVVTTGALAAQIGAAQAAYAAANAALAAAIAGVEAGAAGAQAALVAATNAVLVASEALAKLNVAVAGCTIPGFQVIMILALALQLAIQYGIEAQKEQDKKDRRHEIHNQRNKIITELLKKDTKATIVKNNASISDYPAYLTRNKEGRIPSHFAAIAGNPEPQKILNDSVKDTSVLGTMDDAGYTPLMYALMRGRVDNLVNSGLSDTLLARGLTKNDNAQGSTLSDGSAFANPVNLSPMKTALMFETGKVFDAVFKVVKDGDVYTDAEGRNILHYAALGGKRIKEMYNTYNGKSWYTCLLDKPSLDIGVYRGMNAKSNPMVLAADMYGATPIHYAAATSAQGLKFLLSKTDKINFTALKDKNGMTPLHYAALAGKEEAAEAILNHVKNNKEKEELLNMKVASNDTYGNAITPKLAGKTARDLAMTAGYPGIVRHLSKKMGETKKEMGKKEWKEMRDEAQEEKHERRADKKEEMHGGSASKRMDTWQARDIKKKTETDPMIKAAKEGRQNVVEVLAKQNHDVTLQEPETGRTALMYAVDKGRKEMVKMILDAATKQGVKDALLATKDSKNQTARTLTKNKDILDMLK